MGKTKQVLLITALLLMFTIVLATEVTLNERTWYNTTCDNTSLDIYCKATVSNCTFNQDNLTSLLLDLNDCIDSKKNLQEHCDEQSCGLLQTSHDKCVNDLETSEGRIDSLQLEKLNANFDAKSCNDSKTMLYTQLSDKQDELEEAKGKWWYYGIAIAIGLGAMHFWHTDWKFRVGKEKHEPVGGEGRRTPIKKNPIHIPHQRLTSIPPPPQLPNLEKRVNNPKPTRNNNPNWQLNYNPYDDFPGMSRDI